MNQTQAPKQFADDIEQYWAYQQDLIRMESLLLEARSALESLKTRLYRNHYQHCGQNFQIGNKIVMLPHPAAHGQTLPEPIFHTPPQP